MCIQKDLGADVVYAGLTDSPLNEASIQPVEAMDHHIHLGLAGIDFEHMDYCEQKPDGSYPSILIFSIEDSLLLDVRFYQNARPAHTAGIAINHHLYLAAACPTHTVGTDDGQHAAVRIAEHMWKSVKPLFVLCKTSEAFILKSESCHLTV